MKLLVAADGSSMDSRVSKRFARTAFFLEITVERQSITAITSATQMEKREAFGLAAQGDVDTLIAGTIGPHAFPLMSARRMRVARAPGMPVREALKHYLDGRLKPLDAPTLEHAVEEHEQQQLLRRREHGRHHGQGITSPRDVTPTPRGRHHLQQLGGRGH